MTDRDPNQAPRRARWVRPQLTRLKGGAAENAPTPTVGDGIYSFGS